MESAPIRSAESSSLYFRGIQWKNVTISASIHEYLWFSENLDIFWKFWGSVHSMSGPNMNPLWTYSIFRQLRWDFPLINATKKNTWTFSHFPNVVSRLYEYWYLKLFLTIETRKAAVYPRSSIRPSRNQKTFSLFWHFSQNNITFTTNVHNFHTITVHSRH